MPRRCFDPLWRVALLFAWTGACTGSVLGQTNTTIANGDWQATGTWGLGHVPLAGEDVVVAHTVTNTASTPVLSSMTVQSNKTLVLAGWTNVMTATNVTVDGTFTHVACATTNDPTNRVYVVCTNLAITGIIDANARGYMGGVGAMSPGSGPGRGRGNEPGGSGGYGGEGCNQAAGGAWSGYGVTYGDFTNPVGPGSGGGGSSFGGDRGGNGGGSVWLEVAATATVSGTIRANGGDAFGGGHEGGGSGGGVFLRAGILTGKGTISANGGNGRWNAGGGGGGRVCVSIGLGTEIATTVSKGGAYDRTPGAWPAGSNGAYVLMMDNLILTVQGNPANHGTAVPYDNGRSSVASDTWVTNAVNSPADTSNGVRYICTGWSLTTNGAAADSGGSTQAVFQMLATNTVLTYLWTNQLELAVTYATNGTATVASNGWYTNGMTVGGLQAVPDGGCEFLQWSGDVTTSLYTNNPLTLLMDRRRWITAHFGSTGTGTNRTFAGGDWFAWTNWTPQGIPGRLDTGRLTGGTTALSLPVVLDTLVVYTNATLSVSNWDTVLRPTTLIVTGTVTHVGCDTNNAPTNRIHVITSNLTVAAGGSFNADAKGYKGGGSDISIYNFTMDGFGPGAGKGGIAGNYGGGGGFGGEGCNASTGGAIPGYGQTNGTALYPVGPGSGGGRGDYRGGSGDGGGSIWIEAAATVTMNGTISANGGTAGNGWSGGGSGGAIYLKAGTLAGTGSLNAKGGGGNFKAGGAGGGRIHVEMASGSELAHDVTGGPKGSQADAWPVGSNGTYRITLLGQALYVAGDPVAHDTPAPWPYGASSLPAGVWVTNSVTSPADSSNGVRYSCLGWTVLTNGAPATNGNSTQAVFQMVSGVTNTTLTYFWTNQYQLTVQAATNGTVTSGVNGWYTQGVAVAGIQADPLPGYQFLQWAGDVPWADRTNSVVTVTMDRPRTLTAHFIDPTNALGRSRGGGDWFDWSTWSPAGVPGPNDAVTVTGGTVVLSYPVSMATLTLTNCTLVFTNWDTFLQTRGDVLVATNAMVTHAGGFRFPQDMSNRVWIIAASVFVNGSVNVSGKGYFRGRIVSYGPDIHGQGPGRGYSPGSGIGGGGGGYGGRGGKENDPTPPNLWWGLTYGDATNPIGPGSGGAWGADWGPDGGGNGGGSVFIDASYRVVLNGPVNADGQDNQGNAWGGGGSGGAIWIKCKDLEGGGGTNLTAHGGTGNYGGGGGGGGRISVWYYRRVVYSGTNNVAGGVRTGGSWSGNQDGAPGTYVQLYAPLPQGTLFVVH